MIGKQTRVAGVDGCKSGWIFLSTTLPPATLGETEIAVADSFLQLTEALKNADAICIEIPIGFSADGTRHADVQARKLLGRPRGSSVFPPPPRAVIEASGDYATLNALSRSIRAGLPRQTYGILPKMREVDAAMTPQLQQRFRETHPEVSFATLAGRPMLHNKKTASGHEERLELLQGVFGPQVHNWKAPRGAALDDLLDAAVLAWTASRILAGEAHTLPPAPPTDARGLRMEIVY